MLVLIAFIAALAPLEPPSDPLPEITVVARRAQTVRDTPVAASVVVPNQAAAGAAHPNELLDGVPGTWVSRGSGQEHLTAIRSPVLTGAGACGAFLYLEDGIPIRPAGFCNVNNLFELNLEQAAQVEVLRGPGSALHGSNALHGAVNVVSPAVATANQARVGLWLGGDDFRRAEVSASRASAGLRLDAVLVDAGSFRADEEYQQQKLNLRWEAERGGATGVTTLAATNLNQETAGFVFGLDAYRDPALRTANVNPEAFRDARALRLASRWQWRRGDREWELTPFARASRMEFLQHFLPGQPLEENGQDSAGLQLLVHQSGAERSWHLGLDLEYADGFLVETQAAPITTGSPFLQQTRPAGRHYDYRVEANLLAAYGQWQWRLGPDWRLDAGLRLEALRFAYDNRMSTGNLREDGSACGFGGCLFNRPADRRDRFLEPAPKLALSRRLGDRAMVFARLSRGFRAPQTSELYRLQRGQDVGDLDPERLDSVELGWRHRADRFELGLTGYAMRKRHFIFRDADGFNLSDGRTRHRGLEWEWRLDLAPGWRLAGAGSYARHEYAFTRDAAGERIVDGNEVDTAPRWLARTALDAELGGGQARLEWLHQGAYYLDAANEHRYPGHDLLHVSWARDWGRWALTARLDNLTNRRYAERADFAFGNYRYFPGAGRTAKLGLELKWD